MKLKYITFIFENCDSITIDGRYVGDFIVDDIQTYIARIASNSIDKMEIVHTFVIEIHKDANVERYQHNQTHIERFKQMTFDRFVDCNDITGIEFELEDTYVENRENPCMEHYCYGVNWSGDSDYYNESQVNYISKDGHLYIVIAKDNSIEKFFDLETINDSEYTDFKWEMYGVYEGTV